MNQLSVRTVVLSLFVSIVTLLGAAPAHAVLITTDWLAPGDGLVVRDTTSGLEWLNLTQTANLSVAQVSAELGAGAASRAGTTPATARWSICSGTISASA